MSSNKKGSTQPPTEVDSEILEARKKFAEKFVDNQLGGKGTQWRKHQVKHRTNKVEVDKKIEAVAKKAQSRKLNEIIEINIFKDDETVIHFKKPTLEYSFKEKVSFVSGPHEQKNIKEYFPDIIKQLGPKQFSIMKELAETLKKKNPKQGEAPELIEDFDKAKDKKEDNCDCGHEHEHEQKEGTKAEDKKEDKKKGKKKN